MSRRHHIDDDAVEAFFNGHDAGEELAPLTGFAEELASLASGPPPAPSALLATMLAAGFSTEKCDLPERAASNVPGPARQAAGLPNWRRRMIGSIAGFRLATKVVLGATMAAASVTAAGAAEVLPAPAQHAVSSVVEAATPFSFPDKADDNSNFGERVSTDARDGGVDGKAVNEDAKDNGEANRSDGAGDHQDNAKPVSPGQRGLDKANTTPAAGHVPTSLPAAEPTRPAQPVPGSDGATGLDTARATPAGGHIPEFVGRGTADGPPPSEAGAPSSSGLGTAGGTPAGDRVPASAPPATRGSRP